MSPDHIHDLHTQDGIINFCTKLQFGSHLLCTNKMSERVFFFLFVNDVYISGLGNGFKVQTLGFSSQPGYTP